ncbi:MAG: hypothetical protein FJ404_02900 [Verrucomicrobia bacterium]|nr:hypothetical protein [Verrucomicrobiota bacterium]
MRGPWNKYLQVIRVGIQNTLAYRVNFLARACFGLIPLMATISLWKAVYAGKGPDTPIGPYTLAGMISYYLYVTFVDALTSVTEDDWQVASDIKDGRISQFLIKPIEYLPYRLCLFFSGRLVYASVALIPAVGFGIYLREYWVLPADLETWLALMISLAMAALLQFFISCTVAFLAFWVAEVSTFIFIVFAIEHLASGHLFPLDILPPAVAKLAAWTPFHYQLFFPISIALGNTQGLDLWRGLAAQAGWVLAAWGLARWVWARGIRNYTAVGG